MIQFKLNEKPLSINGAYLGRKIKSDAYRQHEKTMLLQMPAGKVDPTIMLRVELFFGYSSQASDIDNGIKVTIDIAQKKYGFNDKNVFELNVRKCIVKKGEEFIQMGIYPLLPF
jgi:Holliday junction resolvase RusA-like endonuclease